MAWILQFRPASLLQGWNPYVVSLVATALSAATYLALLPISGERTLYVVFLPAAVAAALIGGFGPAMVAVGGGLLTSVIVLQGALLADSGNLVDSLLFAVAGLAVAVAGQLHQRRTREG